MAPRRSTRASLPSSEAVALPTPARAARSTPSGSSTPTPALSASKSSVTTRRGLVTPGSMSDDGTEVSEEAEESLEEVEIPITYGRKRKGSSEKSSPFTSSPPVDTKKYVLESVTVPARRSRLGQEQTTSQDNLTLGSPQSKRNRSSSGVKIEQPDPSSDPLDIISPLDATFPKANGSKAKPRASTHRQPFSVGTFSSVKKQSAADLKLSARDVEDIKSELASDSSASAAKPKAKSRARGRTSKKPPTPSPSESDFEPAARDDFALDSDEEATQLKAAIKASAMRGVLDRLDSATPTTSNMQTPMASSSAGPSRDSSAPPSRARGAAGRKKRTGDFVTAKDVLTGKKASAKATVRATKSRGGISKHLKPGDIGTLSVERESGVSTPLDSISDISDPEDDDSDFEGSSPSESALSALSSSDDDDSGSDAAPIAKKRKYQPKKKPARNSKVKKQESDDGSQAEEDDNEESDAEEAGGFIVPKGKKGAKPKRVKREKKEDEKMSSIRKEEARMKAELGRKLTNGEKNIIRLVRHHEELRDVWGDLAVSVKPIKPVTMEAHPSLKLKLLPFQKESLYWMKKQEEGIWKGGMLADEMGMGKTIQTIALLLSEPRRKPSLVVAPVVALMQWKHEIENNTDGFTVCVWHGQGRMKAKELQQFDVVLVSYGTLEASFRRQQRGFKRGDLMIKEKSPMHSFEWYRVILDEAHNIKERSTNAAKAAFALEAKYKWCLSGTPLQNRVGELYSLVRFLGADPFSHYFCKKCDCKSLHWKFSDKRHCDQCKHKPMDHVCFWNTEILTPIARYGIEQGNPGHTAFKKLKILLDRMMLRRTKLERADDLGLPPRTIVVRRDYFSPEEKELYMSLFTGAKRQFATYIDQGTVLNNYSNIFSLITRMRQMACHPDLVLKSKTSALGQSVEEGTVCRICNDTAEDAIISQCKHLFDRECIRQYLEVQQLRGHRPECPVCHIEISIDLEAEPVDLEDMPNNKKARQGILSRLNLDNWRSSSKLEALVEELEKLRNKDCTIKSLVFSQFVSFLDLIAFRLQRAGFTICRLEGGMTPQQRDATIQHFMKNTNVTVFLISLKAGGVALNLTEASMVFMMDSWWNPSVEYQAMDRIHRLGQKRPVKVVKLVVEDSIEDQHKKLAMTEAALSTDPDAALGKLTVEDLGFLFKM